MLTKSVAAYPPEKLKFHQHPSSLLLPIFFSYLLRLYKLKDTNLQNHSLYNYFCLDGFCQSLPGYQHHGLSRTLYL